MIPVPERVFEGLAHWYVWFAVPRPAGRDSIYRGIVTPRFLHLVRVPK